MFQVLDLVLKSLLLTFLFSPSSRNDENTGELFYITKKKPSLIPSLPFVSLISPPLVLISLRAVAHHRNGQHRSPIFYSTCFLVESHICVSSSSLSNCCLFNSSIFRPLAVFSFSGTRYLLYHPPQSLLTLSLSSLLLFLLPLPDSLPRFSLPLPLPLLLLSSPPLSLLPRTPSLLLRFP
jgi:hypothetical protein